MGLKDGTVPGTRKDLFAVCFIFIKNKSDLTRACTVFVQTVGEGAMTTMG